MLESRAPSIVPDGNRALGRQSRGFSLLELLVVISIISVLAAVVTVSFSSAQRSIDNGVCVSHLKVLAAAAVSYATDNTGHLPTIPAEKSNQPPFGSAGQDYLMICIYPYAQSPSLFQCPTVLRNADPLIQSGRYKSTYNQNPFTFAEPLASVHRASDTILIYEGYPNNDITGTPPHHSVNSSPVSPCFLPHGGLPPGEGGSMNAAMVDGSVSSGLVYWGWGDPRNTLPENGGVWGNSFYTFGH